MTESPPATDDNSPSGRPVLDGWVWPAGAPSAISHLQIRAGGLDIRHPEPDLDVAGRLVASLRTSARVLAAIPSRELIAALGQAGESFVNSIGDNGLWRVAQNAGLSREMTAEVVSGMAATWSTEALEGLVCAEFPDPRVLDGFVPDNERLVSATAPGITLHLGAGSVPGVTVMSIIRALLVKSPVLAKPGAGDVALTAAFARHLGRLDPRLGAAAAVQYWPGGTAPWARWEKELFAAADQVVVYGSDATVESVRARTPASIRLIEHGHRIGVAVVDPTGDPGAVSDAARAVALFDQEGCVSTHLFFVLGDRAAAREWSGALADALSEIEFALPPGHVPAGELSAIHQMRGLLEMEAASGRDTELWYRKGLRWTVILGGLDGFSPAGGRTAWVIPAADVADCLQALSPLSPVLQTVGIAGIGEERQALAEGLARIGATRVVPLREVAFPGAEWLHDGHRPLRELVRWTELH